MMGRKRLAPTVANSTEDENVKVTMTTCAAGPQGIARPGTVLDLPDQRAKEMIDGHFARDYDAGKDAKNPRGFSKIKDDERNQ